MRLGTYYRSLIWRSLNIRANGEKVLDVGAFDGYWLSKQHSSTRICIDKNPVKKYGNVIYLKADALALPFPDKLFDQVFAFDVIEHVHDDRRLLNELSRVTKENGEIIISTPHKYISIFPPFLTSWVSKKWGHYQVSGYLENGLMKIIPENTNVKFILVKESFYRFFYLPLRLFWSISNRLTKPIVKIIAFLDALFLRGAKGHIVVIMIRKMQ